VFFVFFFNGTGVHTQGIVLTKQVLYCLSNSGYIEGMVSETVCPDWPQMAVLLDLSLPSI
jgi:hypothetical protein